MSTETRSMFVASRFSYRLELSGGLGHSAGKIWRVGLMGYNARPDVVTTLLRVLKEAIDHVKA